MSQKQLILDFLSDGTPKTIQQVQVGELLRIQGFPTGYVLKGTQTDQKKFIGNSVEVTTAMKLAECYGPQLFSDVAVAV